MALPTLNNFAIRTFDFPYIIAESNVTGVSSQADFVIDGVPLGKTLNIWPDRPWFGRTRFERTREVIGVYVDEMLGIRIPRTQLSVGRLPLYGCHCDADTCGLVSCVVRREGNIIRWENIAWENDDDEDHTRYGKVDALTFDYAQYLRTINRFVAQIRVLEPLPALADH